MQYLLRLTETWIEEGAMDEGEHLDEKTCIHVRNALFDDIGSLVGAVAAVVLKVTEQNVEFDAHHISRSTFHSEVSIIFDQEEIVEADEGDQPTVNNTIDIEVQQ